MSPALLRTTPSLRDAPSRGAFWYSSGLSPSTFPSWASLLYSSESSSFGELNISKVTELPFSPHDLLSSVSPHKNEGKAVHV